MLDIILQFLGLGIGLIYLYYEYHANPRLWIVGLVMPLVSMWVYFRKGLYADFGMNIYYLLMAVYGYLAWTGLLHRNKQHKKQSLAISHIPAGACAGIAALTGLLWIGIALFLKNATDSTVPWADAFTTALSITATWMLARKYIEQWLAWVLVDSVCVALYVYKNIYPYAILYAVYTSVAVLGYIKWKKMMRQ